MGKPAKDSPFTFSATSMWTLVSSSRTAFTNSAMLLPVVALATGGAAPKRLKEKGAWRLMQYTACEKGGCTHPTRLTLKFSVAFVKHLRQYARSPGL